MTRLLICNADDFGRAISITDAIIDCYRNGILTSTTLMANMPAAEYACQRAKEVEGLGVGVHLTLTEGSALSKKEDVRNLVNNEGIFHPILKQRDNLWRAGSKVGRQIEREFSAQMERAIGLGIKPAHCDSHHGIHSLAIVRDAMIKVVRDYGIFKVRNQIGKT